MASARGNPDQYLEQDARGRRAGGWRLTFQMFSVLKCRHLAGGMETVISSRLNESCVVLYLNINAPAESLVIGCQVAPCSFIHLYHVQVKVYSPLGQFDTRSMLERKSRVAATSEGKKAHRLPCMFDVTLRVGPLPHW